MTVAECQPFVPPEQAERLRRRVRQILEKHAGSVLSLIGSTPLVDISRLTGGTGVRVLAKLEGRNPAGSMKDRMVLYLVADAMERGMVLPDTTLVEASSGNTGISLAMVGAVLGVKVLITAADNVSVERYKLIRGLGAQLELTPGNLGTDGAIERARELSRRPGYYWVAQHFNPVNSFAHYETTGAEIVHQVRDLGLPGIDAFVACSGTTGTLMGVSARLRSDLPGARVVSVWPKDKIMGIRRPEGHNCPGIYDKSLIDDVVELTYRESMEVAAAMVHQGILLGPSGGAAMAAALQVAQRLARMPGRGTVVVLIPDSGERYLSLVPA